MSNTWQYSSISTVATIYKSYSELTQLQTILVHEVTNGTITLLIVH